MHERTEMLPDQVLSNVRHLRQLGYCALDICHQLGLDRESELKAVSNICAQPGLRRFQKGTEAGGPVTRKSGGYWAR